MSRLVSPSCCYLILDSSSTWCCHDLCTQATSIADMIGVNPDDITGVSTVAGRGYGAQCIQRWLMAQIIASAPNVSDAKSVPAVPEGAYEEVIHRYLICLAAAVVGMLICM